MKLIEDKTVHIVLSLFCSAVQLFLVASSVNWVVNTLIVYAESNRSANKKGPAYFISCAPFTPLDEPGIFSDQSA